jgi:hypothetical protein
MQQSRARIATRHCCNADNAAAAGHHYTAAQSVAAAPYAAIPRNCGPRLHLCNATAHQLLLAGSLPPAAVL